jgi:xanthine dehydrogenase accessory factor
MKCAPTGHFIFNVHNGRSIPAGACKENNHMSTLYEELRDQLNQEKGAALATVVRGIEHVGAKLLVFPGKRTSGTLGSAALDARVIEDADHATWHGEAGTHTYTVDTSTGTEAYDVFIEGFPPPPTLVIVGAGHIAIPLTTYAKTLNYRVVVIDARAAFATRERFPHADELIIEWPDEILEKMDLNPSTSVAVLTHDPKFDEPTLKVVLNRQVGYVGAIGSRKTSEERNERLKKQGLTDEQIAIIHGPIGLNIGATSPEEMALAIMAEVVATRHGKDHTATASWKK